MVFHFEGSRVILISDWFSLFVAASLCDGARHGWDVGALSEMRGAFPDYLATHVFHDVLENMCLCDSNWQMAFETVRRGLIWHICRSRPWKLLLDEEWPSSEIPFLVMVELTPRDALIDKTSQALPMWLIAYSAGDPACIHLIHLILEQIKSLSV